VVFTSPNAEQLVERLNDIIRRHCDEPALDQPVLIDLGEPVPISYVELADLTEQCRQSDCHCAYGPQNPPADAPTQGVHLAVVIGGHWD
jgi:hypothetical protein